MLFISNVENLLKAISSSVTPRHVPELNYTSVNINLITIATITNSISIYINYNLVSRGNINLID